MITNDDWLPLIAASSWCALHFAICLLARLESERDIFVFHALSFLALAIVLTAWKIFGSISILSAEGSLFLHGIYSLSFLELWSLSQGSYSLGILDSVSRTGHTGRSGLLAQMAKVGTDKKMDRISALSGIGLLSIKNNQASLSTKGRLAAAAIGTLRALAGIRDVG